MLQVDRQGRRSRSKSWKRRAHDNIVLKPDPAGFYTATATKQGKRVNLVINSTGGVLER